MKSLTKTTTLALLMASAGFAQALFFAEDFPGASLDPSWQQLQAVGPNYSFTDSQIPSVYSVGGGQLFVDDVITTLSGNHTADLVFRRDVGSVAGDFEASFDFTWNMTSSEEDTPVENSKAVPRILLRLLDADLNTLIEVGFEDQGYSGGGSTGNLVAGFNVAKLAGFAYPYKVANNDIVGGARFDVIRDDGDVFIFRDGGDTPVLSGSATGAVAMSKWFSDAGFGRGAPPCRMPFSAKPM